MGMNVTARHRLPEGLFVCLLLLAARKPNLIGIVYYSIE